MSKPSQVIVVLEDSRQKMLIRRYLIKCGMEHKMRIEQPPPGQGSAESWVRQRFVTETNAYRSRQTRAKTALIVMIDADIRTVQDRFNQLDQALTDSGKETVGQSEQIARLVPKRNVETWILCLNEVAVDEEKDYKPERHDWIKLIRAGIKTLYKWTRPKSKLPNHFVDSLRTGVQELKRLTF